nr:MAG: hypothetical protein EDM05_07525 [Leptolyngbya sp. IPPAS B-1204]
MFFPNIRLLTGAASLIACLAAAYPSVARPLASQEDTLSNSQVTNSQVTSQDIAQLDVSQVNRPPEEGVPPRPTDSVRGTITSIQGDRVTIELENGETRTYSIAAENENRDGLEVGNQVVLTVARGFVLAVSNQVVEVEPAPVVIRREAPVQEPVARPAPAPPPAPAPAPRPAPAPAPAVQPAPQPVRGMW